MQKEFIPYKEALALKDLGFEEPCFGFFRMGDEVLFPHTPIENHIEDLIMAPLYQQAFKWLFKEFNTYGTMYPFTLNSKTRFSIYTFKDNIWVKGENIKTDDLEVSELACLKGLIESIKIK